MEAGGTGRRSLKLDVAWNLILRGTGQTLVPLPTFSGFSCRVAPISLLPFSGCVAMCSSATIPSTTLGHWGVEKSALFYRLCLAPLSPKPLSRRKSSAAPDVPRNSPSLLLSPTLSETHFALLSHSRQNYRTTSERGVKQNHQRLYLNLLLIPSNPPYPPCSTPHIS